MFKIHNTLSSDNKQASIGSNKLAFFISLCLRFKVIDDFNRWLFTLSIVSIWQFLCTQIHYADSRNWFDLIELSGFNHFMHSTTHVSM